MPRIAVSPWYHNIYLRDVVHVPDDSIQTVTRSITSGSKESVDTSKYLTVTQPKWAKADRILVGEREQKKELRPYGSIQYLRIATRRGEYLTPRNFTSPKPVSPSPPLVVAAARFDTAVVCVARRHR